MSEPGKLAGFQKDMEVEDEQEFVLLLEMVLLEVAAAFVQATGPFSNPGLLSMYPMLPGSEEAEALQKEAGSSQGELEPVLVK